MPNRIPVLPGFIPRKSPFHNAQTQRRCHEALDKATERQIVAPTSACHDVIVEKPNRENIDGLEWSSMTCQSLARSRRGVVRFGRMQAQRPSCGSMQEAVDPKSLGVRLDDTGCHARFFFFFPLEQRVFFFFFFSTRIRGLEFVEASARRLGNHNMMRTRIGLIIWLSGGGRTGQARQANCEEAQTPCPPAHPPL